MKKLTAATFLALLLAMSHQPSSVMAYTNNVDLTLMSGSGSYESDTIGLDADISLLEWGIEYNRYLSDISTDSSPYGAREFLQHPSKFGVSLNGMGMNIEDNNSAAEVTTAEVDIAFGGMYYLDNGDIDTGLGLTLISIGGSREKSGATFGGLGDDDISGSALVLSVNQYLSKNVSIGLDIESGSYEEEDNLSTATEDHDQTLFSLSLKALLQDKIHLEASLSTGETDYDLSDDEDFSAIELLVGYYINQKTGLFIGLNSETIEETGGTEQEMTMIQFSGDFYFNERIHLMASLANMKNEITTSSIEAEMKANIINLNLGFFF